MPLSDHEQRLLEQMERALSAEDPKFASALRGSDPRVHYRRRVLLAGIGVFAGIVMLVTGVLVAVPTVSVLGFLVMLASVLLGVTSWRQIPQAGNLGVAGKTPTPGNVSKISRHRPSLMSRLEQRWDRRRDDRDN